MATGKAEEAAAGIGVVMRCSLARKIGMEHQVSCRRIGPGKGLHQAVDVGTGDLAQPGDAVAGGKDHAHLMPGVRHGMAEGMRPAFGRRREFFRDGKDNARGSQRQKTVPRRDNAKAGRGRRIVAAAAGNDRLPVDSPGLCDIFPKATGHGAPLDKARHLTTCQTAQLQQPVGPVAGPDIEPQRSGRVRHFRHGLAGQAEAKIVLRQQDHGCGGKKFGLVLRHPDRLRGCEPRHHGIAADRAELGMRVVHPRRL